MALQALDHFKPSTTSSPRPLQALDHFKPSTKPPMSMALPPSRGRDEGCSQLTNLKTMLIQDASTRPHDCETPLHLVPRLPIELCEMVIDHIALLSTHISFEFEWTRFEAREWRITLIACAHACKGWYDRSMYHLQRNVWLSDREQAVSLSNHLRRHHHLGAAIRHAIFPEPAPGLYTLIPHFTTFVLMLARRIPNITSLTLIKVIWKASSMHAYVFECLPVHSTITHLRLYKVMFEKPSQFASLISAIPNLRHLTCAFTGCLNKYWQSPSRMPRARVCEIVLFNTDHDVANVLAEFNSISSTVEILSFHASHTASGSAFPGRGLLVTQAGQKLLNAFGASLRSVELTDRDGWAETRTFSLSRQSNLTTLVVTHLFTRCPNLARTSAALSTIISTSISSIHIRYTHDRLWAFRENLWDLVPPFDEEQNKANIDAARNIDEILSGSIFAKFPPSSVRFELELMTANDADIAAEQKVGEGNWERFLSQNMPRAAARGILDCALILVKEAVTVLPVTSSPSNVWAKEYSKHILNASHAKVDPAPEAD